MPGTPDLHEWLEQLLDDVLHQVNTILPGRVVSYDASTRRATIEPGFARWQPKTEGVPAKGVTARNLPSVPVMMPGLGGGWTIATSPQAGDRVLLLCCQRRLEPWLAGDGGQVLPPDGPRHDKNDAIAIVLPELGATTANLVIEGHGARVELTTDGEVRISGAAVRLGDATATLAVALATRVATELNAFKAAYNAHTHPIVVGGVVPGSGAGTGSSSVTVSQAPATGNMASSSVFAEG